MGFPNSLVNLIMKCISSVSSKVYSREARKKEIHGIKVARQAAKTSHLFFANDSLLFTQANLHEAENIMEVLLQYQNSSGQVVNMEKSEASFSGNVSDEVKCGIRSRMGVKHVQSDSKYLELPVVFGRSKREVFTMVVERVWKKNQRMEGKVSF
ncbi:unnamed protein product [Vicia faba]|uniref:Reverse transcriptase n=1 Tax=Vicia faba TaxID=3906 RepID=A0AAV0YG07_VICFA|nr:unnamed protein product [Vicia faba]